MKKIYLIIALMVVLLASFASAAVVWDSQDHWTAANSSIPGWTESAGKLEFEINTGLQLYSDNSQRNQITRVNDDDYIYYMVEDGFSANVLSHIYWIDATRRIVSTFNVNGSIDIDHSLGEIQLNNVFGKEVKYVIDEPNQNFTVFLDDVQQGGILKALPVAGTAYRHSWDTNGGTSANISWYCTDDDGISCVRAGGGGGTSSINISTPKPLNSNSFNTLSLNINTTVNSSDDFNCSLYIDGVLNQSQDNFTVGVDRFVNYTLTFSPTEESSFDYYINCYDSIGSTNTTNQTFYIDNVLPNINWFNPLNTNRSITSWNFTSNISVYDPNIYSYQYNITYSNGTSIYNFSNTSLTGFTNVSIIENTNLTDHYGLLNAVVTVCDGHTNNKIDFNARTSDKQLFFSDDSITVYPSNKNNYQTIGFYEEDDRYSFNFVAYNPARTHSFYVESTDFIDILHGKTKYSGHLVIGNKWLDFMTTDISEVIVERINNNKVKVIVTLTKEKKFLEFNSIGELNCVTETKKFLNYEYNELYSTPVSTQSINNFILNVTYDVAFSTNVTARLTYNNTEYSVVGVVSSGNIVFTQPITAPVVYTQTNVSFYWNFNIDNNFINTTTKNQTIDTINIDDCSTYSVVGLNFTLYNESGNSRVNGNISIFLNYSVGNFSATKNINFSGKSNYGVCVFPATANFSLYSQMEYGANGFISKTYYLAETFLNNITKYIDLYLSDGTTQVKFSVVDVADTPVNDVYIKVLKYDLGTDSYEISEILKTDSNGETFGQIILNDQWYKFILERNGLVVLETEPTKIDSTSKKFRINILEDYFENYNNVNGITNTLTYNNVTQTFTFFFNDPSQTISAGCLRLERRGINNFDILNDTCVSSTSGTINIRINESTGRNTYTAIAYVQFSSDEEFFIGSISTTFNEVFKTFGLSGLFVTFLLVVGIAMAFIWNPSVAIVLSIIAITFSIILGIFHLSWLSLSALLILTGVVLYYINKNGA